MNWNLKTKLNSEKVIFNNLNQNSFMIEVLVLQRMK